MTLDLTRPVTAFAIGAVRRAALLARDVQRETTGQSLSKEDRSPVTVADFAAQAVVARMLGDADPDAVLVAEEDAAMLRSPEGAGVLETVTEYVRRVFPDATRETVCAWIDRGAGKPSGRFWTLDPIDGTKGFLRGGQYAVALALIEEGTVRLGVLGCPALTDAAADAPEGPGTVVVSERGAGTWAMPLDGEGPFRRLRVSDCADPARARLLRSVEAAHTNTDRMGRLAAALGATTEPVRLDSQAKYAVLASGAGDLLFRLLSSRQPDYEERIWDQAAGSIVVEEAGGRVTDLSGAPLDFTAGRTLARNRGVLASNGPLHELALVALRTVG